MDVSEAAILSCFYKKGVLKICSNLTGEHTC